MNTYSISWDKKFRQVRFQEKHFRICKVPVLLWKSLGPFPSLFPGPPGPCASRREGLWTGLYSLTQSVPVKELGVLQLP